MKKIIYILVVVVFGTSFSPYCSIAENESNDFDFIVVLTQQDLNMDWWFSVPSQFLPKVSSISEVVKGEFFKILPIFKNYGTTTENKVHIKYDLEILRPDGTVYNSTEKIKGFQGPASGPFLLPAERMICVAFEPEDSYGDYTINVTAFDNVKKQRANQSLKITLDKFKIKGLEDGLEDWFIKYPIHPRPSYALFAFINTPRPYLDEKGHPLWSAIWLYKHIFAENKFLITHTVEFYKTEANKQQQKDIILLFHLLDKIKILPIDENFNEYVAFLKKINIPSPYQEITSGDQLDMLWAEFFATSRIKPIRQIITALNLSEYFGIIEKIKSKEIELTKDAQKKANLEAVFCSALWSIKSNCKQSPLVFRYCVSLYQSDELNKTERGLLGAILKKTSKEMETESHKVNSADAKSRAAD